MAEEILVEERQRNVYDPLADIIERRGSAADSIFNTYRNKTEIAAEILKELTLRFEAPKNKSLGGFCMSDTSGRNKDIGLLSQCQSLQALVTLASDFNLGFEYETGVYITKDEVSKEKERQTIRSIMDMVIEDVVARIEEKDEEGNLIGYRFDASPYADSQFSAEYSNIDAISWVLPSFFTILKYHAEIKEVCKWENQLVAIIKHGLDYLIDAFIDEAADTPSSKLSIGWNFTKNCEEPSLYFSFAACECFLDLYTSFEKVLKYPEAVRDYEKYGIAVDPKLVEILEREKKDYEDNKNRARGELNAQGKEIARFDEFNELARLYRLINDIEEEDPLRIDDSTRYGRFEACCKKLAATVWKFVRNNLADKFFYNDLRTTLSEDDIRHSTTSDALFNTVYIVNIMIDAGYDEDLKKEEARQTAADEAEDQDSSMRDREYDNFLESCQLAVQKAVRTYESLKNDGKEYIVDQFLIGFNENFKFHSAMVNELRKLRMRTFSLLPLLIHSNNILGEYLIKYPQYNMRKFLEYILENRFVNKQGKRCWIWERDGFFSGSNYYYIAALSEFYNYYQFYEEAYIEIGKENTRREEEIRQSFLEKLREPDEEIGKLHEEIEEIKREIAKKQEEIARLEREKAEFKRPVEDAVREVILAEMEKNFAKLMTDTFVHAAKCITMPQVDETSDVDNSAENLKNAVLEMMLCAALTKFYKSPGKQCKKDRHDELKARAKTDISGILREYLTSLETASDGKSKLSAMLDSKA